MLKAMRKNLKSLAPTLWLVIAAFIIAIFAVWGGAGRLGETRNANTLLTIGGQKIQAEVYFNNLRQQIEGLQREFKELDATLIKQLNIPQQVLEQLIQQTLLLQLAEELGLQASPEEIKNKIINHPAFQKDGQFIGFAEYKKILDWNRISIANFEDSIRREILIEKTIHWLTAGVTVTPEEVFEYFKKNNESVEMEYVVLETDKIEIKDEPPLEELKNYYQQHQDKYQLPERRKGIYVFLTSEELKKEVKVENEEVNRFYKENKSQFRQPAQTRVSRIFLPFNDQNREQILSQAQEILDKLKNGQDFASLAEKYSQDDKAASGGDWGLYEWQNLSPKEKEALGELQAGEVSDIIEIDQAFVLLKVTEKQAERTKSLEEVQSQIYSTLTDQKARELAHQRLTKLLRAARREKDLKKASEKLGFSSQETKLLRAGEALADIDPAGTISQKLFELEKIGDISEPILSFKGEGIVQLQQIEEARQASFEEAQAEVKNDYLEEKKKELAQQKAWQLRQLARQNSLEQLAKKYNAQYNKVNEHKRGEYLGIIGENNKIDDLAFTLPLNEISEPIPFDRGIILIKALSRQEVTEEDLAQAAKEEGKKLLQEKQNKILISFLAQLREKKKVKINYNLFNQINEDILARFQKQS
ncbi:MAG: hypothetical protein B5M54_01010 [Candidatus Aminicenantes bacterium 4484_214]|nr:MAG: hypothetical protein B5M54_01010 [Candidatus Aminicenantes bacterium 4484_214]